MDDKVLAVPILPFDKFYGMILTVDHMVRWSSFVSEIVTLSSLFQNVIEVHFCSIRNYFQSKFNNSVAVYEEFLHANIEVAVKMFKYIHQLYNNFNMQHTTYHMNDRILFNFTMIILSNSIIIHINPYVIST
jgi:hypothetical protein